MSDVTPADLRATPGRVAVTGCGERVRYHEEMGHQFEHNGDWVMICGTFMDSLDWPARYLCTTQLSTTPMESRRKQNEHLFQSCSPGRHGFLHRHH